MEYKIDNKDDSIFITLKGAFTFNDSVNFRDIIQKLERNMTSQIVFSLAELDFIDSSALGMMLLMREKLGNKGEGIILRNPRGQVLKIFEISDLGSLFQLEN